MVVGPSFFRRGIAIACLACAAASGSIVGCATAGDGTDDTTGPPGEGSDAGPIQTSGRDGAPPLSDGGGGGQDTGSGGGNDAAMAADVPVDSWNGCVHAPQSSCGLVPQCDCTATQTCDVTDLTTGAAQCVAAGANKLTNACNSTADCAPGLTCRGGACRPYCSKDGDSCPTTGGLCVQKVNPPGDAGVPVPNLLVCNVKCDLDNPNACGGTTPSGPIAACVPLTTGHSDCRGVGRSTTSCSGAADCAPGYACVTFSSGGSSCWPWCKVNGGNCGGGASCNAFTTALTVDGVEFGFCQ